MDDTKHVHKYLRVKLGANKFKVYKCVADGCTSYVRAELVVGNHTICWRCGREVPMTLAMAKQKKPHCIGCTWEKPQKATNAA